MADGRGFEAARRVTSCAFGGDNWGELYVVSADNTDDESLGGCIWRCRPGAVGLRRAGSGLRRVGLRGVARGAPHFGGSDVDFCNGSCRRAADGALIVGGESRPTLSIQWVSG